ncbi:MAG TPA: hypothetical protein VJL90_12495 [Pseudorhodoplanes sp.]|nr:hypothetical protein [Pseudorhodoplanes sp.]
MSDSEQTEPVYAYKPSLMGAGWFLRLTPDHLAWTVGRRSGQVPYRDIANIRLTFKPVTMQTRRYLTEIWAPGAPKLVIASATWASMVEQRSQVAPYSEFVRQLHARVAASGARPRCEGGLNPFLYWPGVVVFAALLLGMAAMIARAMYEASWQGALFVLGFMALFVWQIGKFFLLNKPVRYDVDAPPENLLPRA